MAGKNGGARPGAGRPKGVNTKCYTVTLPVEEAEELEKRAGQLGKTVSRYIRDIIEAGGQYGNVGLEEKYVDEGADLLAADKEVPYVVSKPDK